MWVPLSLQKIHSFIHFYLLYFPLASNWFIDWQMSFVHLFFFILFSFIMSRLILVFKSVVGKDFGNYVKNRFIKSCRNVVLYEKQGDTPRMVASAILSGAKISTPNGFQPCFRSNDLNSELGDNFIVVIAVSIHKGCFCVPILFNFTKSG